MSDQSDAQDGFWKSMRFLFKTGTYADLVITCGGNTYQVHKAIVCPRSDFFEAAVRFGKEKDEGKIDLLDDDPEIVRHMIRYFYELDYHVPGETEVQPVAFVFTYARSRVAFADCHAAYAERQEVAELMSELTKENMEKVVLKFRSWYYALGNPGPSPPGHVYEVDYYQDMQLRIRDELLRYIQELHHHNEGTPQKTPLMEKAPVTHAKVYAIADKYNITGLKELAFDKFMLASKYHFGHKGFWDAIQVVYEGTPETDTKLRDLVAKYVCLDLETYGMHPKIEEKLEAFPALAFRVTKAHFGKRGCPHSFQS